MRGYVCATAAVVTNNGTGGVNSADISIMNFFIKMPMFKLNDQMSAQNRQECIFYTTHYRLVTHPLAGTSRQVLETNIFTAARPTWIYYSLYTLVRYNGGVGHNAFATNAHGTAVAVAATENWNGGTHPLRAILADFSDAIVWVNAAIIQPELKNSKEAFLERCWALNRVNRKMPFAFIVFQSDYGWLLFYLSVNKDSFNEELSNSTADTVNFEMTLNAGIAKAPHMSIFVAEFRNQVKIGYNSPARRVYDF